MLIDWFTLGAQAANFLILVWLLQRFLYRPIVKAIDERERLIANQLADAKAIKTLAEQEKSEFEQKNEQFDQQRSELLAQAGEEVKVERAQLLAQARADAEEFHCKFQASVQRELGQMKDQISQRTSEEVLAITRQVLVDLADVQLENQIINVFLARLETLDSQTRKSLESENGAAPIVVRTAFTLSPEQQAEIGQRIHKSLDTQRQVDFEIHNEVINGIDVTLGGRRIAWSMGDYVASLADLISNAAAAE